MTPCTSGVSTSPVIKVASNGSSDSGNYTIIIIGIVRSI